MIMIKLRMFSYNFAFTIMSDILMKYHVVLNFGGIGQFNCNNKSQQRAEAIYGSFDFIGPTHTS